MDPIYLDNNATTAVAPEVLEAMLPWLGPRRGNPSSLHRSGTQAADAVGAARRALARAVGAAPGDVVFTSGGTESDAWALRAWAHAGRRERGARRVLVSAIEHAAVLENAAALEGEGFQRVLVPARGDGTVDEAAFAALLDEAPCAVASVMWVNNETGVIQDVARLGQACRARGVPFHVDGVQALGKLAFALRDLPIDSLALSAHKVHGPKGVGALVLRAGADPEPMIFGGPQERARRAGTENVPGIVGFARAASLALTALSSAQGTAELRDALERGLLERVPDAHANGAAAARVCNTSNVTFEGLSGEALTTLLSELGVEVSTGSACASGKHAPSHVLLAMGADPEQASGSLRFSLSRETTRGEVERALGLVVDAVERLRRLAPR